MTVATISIHSTLHEPRIKCEECGKLRPNSKVLLCSTSWAKAAHICRKCAKSHGYVELEVEARSKVSMSVRTNVL